METWCDPRLEIRLSLVQGKGVFASESIDEGETVMVWGGHLFTREEIRAGKAKPHSVSGFSEGLYLGQRTDDPDMLDQFLNHSCDPNVWMTNEVTLVSRRYISAEEELTADYSMWELDSDWRMDDLCNCSSALCRGVVSGNDWRLGELQARYQAHFLPCINDRIVVLKRSQDSRIEFGEPFSFTCQRSDRQTG